LAFHPHILEASSAAQFVQVGEEAEGRPVHGMFEQDGRSPVQVRFPKTVVTLNLGDVGQDREGEDVVKRSCPYPTQAQLRDEPASLPVLLERNGKDISVGDPGTD
jgi:hypothetical protein